MRGPPESPWQESFPGAEAQSIAYFRNDSNTDNTRNGIFNNKKGTIVIMTIMIIASVI